MRLGSRMRVLVSAFALVAVFAGCDFFNFAQKNSVNLLGPGGEKFDSPTASIPFAATVISDGRVKAIAVDRNVKAVGKLSRIESPVVDGVTVAATHVSWYSSDTVKTAYIAYNTKFIAGSGTNFHGALDVVDVSDPANPRIVQTLSLPRMDVAATHVVTDSGVTYLYVAGRMSPDSVKDVFRYSSPEAVPATAVLERFVIKSDGTFDPAASTASAVLLPGYYVTSVFHSLGTGGRYIFVTTGNNIAEDSTLAKVERFRKGGTFALNKSTFGVLDQDLYDYAMYLDIANANNHHISLEGSDGGNGTLHIYKVGKGDASAHKMINIGPMDVVEENGDGTKNTVDLYLSEDSLTELGFVAMGRSGMKVFDIRDSSLEIKDTPVEKKPVFQVTKLDSSDVNLMCNSVATDGKRVYMAMGSGGLWVADLVFPFPSEPELTPDKTALQGGSANFVTIANGLVFVAEGIQGTTIF